MENSTLMYTQRGIIKNEESFDDYEEQVDRKKKKHDQKRQTRSSQYPSPKWPIPDALLDQVP